MIIIINNKIPQKERRRQCYEQVRARFVDIVNRNETKKKKKGRRKNVREEEKKI